MCRCVCVQHLTIVSVCSRAVLATARTSGGSAGSHQRCTHTRAHTLFPCDLDVCVYACVCVRACCIMAADFGALTSKLHGLLRQEHADAPVRARARARTAPLPSSTCLRVRVRLQLFAQDVQRASSEAERLLADAAQVARAVPWLVVRRPCSGHAVAVAVRACPCLCGCSAAPAVVVAGSMSLLCVALLHPAE